MRKKSITKNYTAPKNFEGRRLEKTVEYMVDPSSNFRSRANGSYKKRAFVGWSTYNHVKGDYVSRSGNFIVRKYKAGNADLFRIK